LCKVRTDHAHVAALRAAEEERLRAAATLEAENQEHARKSVQAAIKLQAFARTLHVWRYVLPRAAEERRKRLLFEGRVELTSTLRDLRRTMHGLSYLEGHQNQSATRIQAWWRGMLAMRIVSVLLVRRKIAEIHDFMELAAMRIQAHCRRRLARASCEALRRQRAERVQRAIREKEARRQRAAVRVQAFYRKISAKSTANRLRTARNREMLLSDGEAAEARNMLRKISCDVGGAPILRAGMRGSKSRAESKHSPRRKREPVSNGARLSSRS